MASRKSAPKTKPAGKKPAAKRAPAKKAPPKKQAGVAQQAERRPSTSEVSGSSPDARSTRAPAKKVKSGPKTLTKRVALFVTEYMVDFNGTRAAIRAGFSAKTAAQAASRMLRMPVVKAALRAEQATARVQEHAEAINRMELTVERTRLEIARLAYFDPRKMFHPDGRPKQITELDDDTAACIAGLEVLEEYDSDGEGGKVLVGHVKKYKVADKNSALDKAAKILGDYEKDNGQKTTPLAEALDHFIGQLHSSGAAKLKPVPPAARPKGGA